MTRHFATDPRYAYVTRFPSYLSVHATGSTPGEALDNAATNMGKKRKDLDPEKLVALNSEASPLDALATLRAFVWREKTNGSPYPSCPTLDHGSHVTLCALLQRQPTHSERCKFCRLIEEKLFQGDTCDMVSGTNPTEGVYT